jgi:hypothetical protein
MHITLQKHSLDHDYGIMEFLPLVQMEAFFS